jgi:hypothetical protein
MSEKPEPPDLRLVSTSHDSEPKKLTQEQRAALAELLARVFVRLRSPGYQYFWNTPEDWNDVKKLQAAVDRSVAYGEVFHNLPRFLFRDGFDFDLQEKIMNGYLKQCPDLEAYIEDLRQIRKMARAGEER